MLNCELWQNHVHDFSINKSNNYESPLLIHNCNNYMKCSLYNWKQIKEISKNRYLGWIFDNNLKCDLHINNLVCELYTIIYKFINLKSPLLSNKTLRNTYLFCFLIFTNQMVFWFVEALKTLIQSINILQQNQNNVPRIILNKKTLEGSTKQNYNLLSALPSYTIKIQYPSK